jgi:hypothetical protein
MLYLGRGGRAISNNNVEVSHYGFAITPEYVLTFVAVIKVIGM